MNPEDVVIEISSDENEESSDESESEPETDDWDNDCKIIKIDCLNPITGYHLMPTCNRDPDEQPKKKIKLSPDIHSNLQNPQLFNEIQEKWKNNRTLLSKNLEIITNPFKVCVVNNFLENPAFLKEIKEEFNELDWNLRSLDLYEFCQSKDLKQLSDHVNISTIYKFLETDVMNWVAKITDLKLTHISATCSVYNNTDYLLVHDDQREDRLVAFILYLTSKNGWSEDKGGALQLINKDSGGQPSEVIRNIFPANNQFIFFPVTNESYHQVAEVTSLSDSRLSINGWFHTDIPPIFPTPEFTPYPEGLYGNKIYNPIYFDTELSTWICEEYLESDIAKEIQEYFEENSEISLKHFLKDHLFSQLLEILNSNTLKWLGIGPPNRYSYEILNLDDLPLVLGRFLNLFQSKQMFSLLKKFTGLEFKEDQSSMKFELQKWTPGCYSLLGDYDWYDQKQLDLVLHFNCKSNSDVIGARTLYVTPDEQIQDALITLEPEENNLNLIYRDTARFTKYFSKQSVCNCFYTLVCSYTE